MPTNIVVKLRRGETSEKLVRRFIRKCKKEKVVETYRAKTDHYIKPSVKKRMKSERARREKLKLERKRAAKRFR
jgi:small subunit ribosomal protein S21